MSAAKQGCNCMMNSARQEQQAPQTAAAPKRGRENEVRALSSQKGSKRTCTMEDAVNTTMAAAAIGARVDFWSENGAWPNEEQEASIQSLRDHANSTDAGNSVPTSKPSSVSSMSDNSFAELARSISRDDKCAAYNEALYEQHMRDCGSFLNEHELGVTPTSEVACRRLLVNPQALPQNTPFSNDQAFRNLCQRMQGENEDKMMQRLSQFLVPSAEVLTDEGAAHVAIVKETTNTCWPNCEPFIFYDDPDSEHQLGPHPQPDFGFGFARSAFSAEQLHRLEPYLGNLAAEYSLLAATDQLFFPFLTCEVGCGPEGLENADRRNAYAQSVNLRGLYTLFNAVGRQNEIHQEINGFSVSHNAEDARIWGHYAVVEGTEVSFYRRLLASFSFVSSHPREGDQRWTAYRFVKNVYDLWVPGHYRRICSAVDMLPKGWDKHGKRVSPVHV